MHNHSSPDSPHQRKVKSYKLGIKSSPSFSPNTGRFRFTGARQFIMFSNNVLRLVILASERHKQSQLVQISAVDLRISKGR